MISDRSSVHSNRIGMIGPGGRTDDRSLITNGCLLIQAGDLRCRTHGAARLQLHSTVPGGRVELSTFNRLGLRREGDPQPTTHNPQPGGWETTCNLQPTRARVGEIDGVRTAKAPRPRRRRNEYHLIRRPFDLRPTDAPAAMGTSTWSNLEERCARSELIFARSWRPLRLRGSLTVDVA
jgi:hypothetical protein